MRELTRHGDTTKKDDGEHWLQELERLGDDTVANLFAQGEKASPKIVKKCGTCKHWVRGGYGSGKGGGSCLQWKIPKYASNSLMKDCWEE